MNAFIKKDGKLGKKTQLFLTYRYLSSLAPTRNPKPRHSRRAFHALFRPNPLFCKYTFPFLNFPRFGWNVAEPSPFLGVQISHGISPDARDALRKKYGLDDK
ncbi:MAG: hypothetical protein SNJ55_11585 [Chloroherpetonaceae bacterium]